MRSNDSQLITKNVLTAITEITRNSNKAANALKTIGQRIRGVGEDGEDASEYVANLQNQFDKLGISIKIVKNSAGEMESTYNILKAMAENWDRLTDAERQALGEAAAGKNRITELNALMSNWQTAVEATSTALESNGSAARENAKVLDSIEGHLQSLRATWQQLSQSMINSEFLKAIIDLGTGLIKLANSGFGKVILRATALFAVLRLSQPVIKKIKQGFQDVLWASKNLSKSWAFLKADTKTLTAYLEKTDKGFKKLTDEEKATSIEAERLRIAQVKVSLIMAAVSTAVSLAIHLYQKHKEKQQEMIDKALEMGNAWKSETEAAKDYKESYEQYYKILHDSNSASEEKADAVKSLTELENKLSEAYGEEALQLDLLNGEYEKQIDLMNKLSNSKIMQYFTENIDTIEKAVKKFENTYKLMGDRIKITSKDSFLGLSFNKTSLDLYKAFANLKGYDVSTSQINAFGSSNVSLFSNMDVYDTLKYLDEFNEYLLENRAELLKNGMAEEVYDATLHDVAQSIRDIKEEYGDYIDIVNQAREAVWLLDEGQAAAKELTELASDGLATDEIDSVLEKYDTLSTLLDKLGIKYDDIIKKFTGKELTQEIEETYETIKSVEGIIKLYAKNLDDIKEKYNELTSAVSEYNEQGYFTKETLQKLIDNDLIQYLENVDGKLKINAEAFDKLAEAERNTAAAALEEAMVEDIRNIALGNTDKVSEFARKAMEDLGKQAEVDTGKFLSYAAGVSAANAAIAGLDVSKEAQKNMQTVLAAYKKIWPQITKIASGGSGSSSGKSAWEKSLESLNNQYKNSQITIEQYITKLEALRKKYKKNKTAVKELDKTLREARLEKLEDDYKRGLISVDAYIKGLKELQKAYKEGTKEWNKYADSIKKGLETLLGDREGKFKDAQKAAVSILDEEIQRIDDLISAKQKENDETERQIELQKLQENLENARRNKNKRVFVTGLGWVYQRDEQAVEEAQKALDDFQSEQEIRNLEKQKELLESYRDSWQDITKSYEQEQNRLLLAEVLGADAEGQILNQRLEVLEDFRDKYIAVLRDLNMLDKTTADSISQDGITLESGGSYANGGVVDYTGYARVHGSVNKPEIVLSNSQAASLYSMLNRPQTSSLKVGSGSNTQIYNFDNLVLPNVSNARQFINELKSITNLTRNQ